MAALKPLLAGILAAGIAICALPGRGATAGFDFSSGIPAYDQAYQKARRVLAADVQDGKFLAGQNWQQVWTRDTSYSVELACALLHPDVSKTTLLGLTQAAFADRYGLSVRTVGQWEQRRRLPDQAAVALLWAIRRYPEEVAEALERRGQTLAEQAAQEREHRLALLLKMGQRR